ncbi:MAG: Ig-like domain-containing protein, partial [Elusimicrobia bacterium]|nr:Ig-like domain-containing protein [Elusimicrobiota bacterium]
TVNAVAADNVAVGQVTLSVDGIVRSTSATSPLSFAWNTRVEANGPHTLLLKASDAAGNIAAQSVTVQIFNFVSLVLNETLTISNDGAGDYSAPDGTLKVHIPPGEGVAAITVTRLLPEDSAVGAYDIKVVGRDATVFTQPATLSFPYSDVDDDGIVDGRDVPEMDLRLYWQDAQQWRLIGGAVDPAANTVTARVSHFSIYALRPLPAAAAASANSRTSFLSPTLVDNINDVAVFDLDVEEVTVHELSGKIVFHQSQQETGGSALAWNCRDESGRIVESGGYIARMKSKSGKTTYQNLIVVK